MSDIVCIDDIPESDDSPRVPVEPPYGSITDGYWICTRCGYYLTGCALCAGEKVSIRKIS